MQLKQKLSNFLDNLGKHEVFVLAGSLAYTTGLALAPFVLILLSAASLLGDANRQKVFESFSVAAGAQASASIEMIVENADKHPSETGLSGIIGFVVLLVSASAIFSQLRFALNKVNEHRATAAESGVLAFVKEKLFSVGLLLGFIFLAIASLIVTTTIAVFAPAGEGVLWELVAFGVNLVVFTFLFAAIYRFVPTDKMVWRRCFVSGLVSAVFFQIGKTLIGLYLAKAGLESAYGAAGSIVVFLAWVYYIALTILVSYEFTSSVLSPAKPDTRSP